MNSTNTKDWHLSQIKQETSPILQSPQNYIPSINYVQSYQNSIYPSVSTSNNYGKLESDSRLPGMTALSEPGTPRPNVMTSPSNGNSAYVSPTFQSATPYGQAVIDRKRSRNHLFSSELGPSFSSTKPVNNLYSLDRSALLTVRIQAKMDRGFFLADNDWTCYRRNYFQVSGAFSIHGLNHYYTDKVQCLVQNDGVFYPVHGFSMNISASVSNSDKHIDLIQHTPKRDKGPQMTPCPKPIAPGGNLSINSVGGNQSIVTFERIQFKTATANNGKRRAAQQYYICLVELYAEIEGGSRRIKIASCQSAPLVVRGRSPGHYSDNHDRYTAGISYLSSPQPQQQMDDSRYVAPLSRPPITPPATMGNEYHSPYAYHSYQGNNYSPYPMPTAMPSVMMPPTPSSGPLSSPLPPHNHQPYMAPGISPNPPLSERSLPDLYHGNGNLAGKLNQTHSNNYMPDEWDRSRRAFQNDSYFSQPTYQTSTSASTSYGPPRRFSIDPSTPQQAS